MSGAAPPDGLVPLLLACAAVTYATRIAGHLVLARLPRIPHRLEAALNAVPIAVLGALIAPAVATTGPAEGLAALVAGLVGLRLSAAWVVALGTATLVAARALGA